MDQEENHLFSIREVSEKLGVPKHTLRFWEKELNGFIVPERTRGGQRRYTPHNLAVLEEVKRCRQRGLALSEIIARIKPDEGAEPFPSQKINLLANRVAELIKTEVYNFFRTEGDVG